jgi:hypothetical protein
MPAKGKYRVDLPPEILLKRKIPLEQASELTSLSKDTLRRRYPDKILKMSERRSAMELGFVLSIGKETA